MEIKITKTTSSKEAGPGLTFFIKRIFPLIFVLIGLITGYLGFSSLSKAKASTKWPTTEGVIISSEVERHRSSGRNSSTTYHADIYYKFNVDGKKFDGSTVAYGDYDSSSSSHARNIVNKYPANAKVKVYYMPDNPTECLLEPGIQAQAFFLPGFGLIFFTVGIFMVIFIPIAMKKQAAESERKKLEKENKKNIENVEQQQPETVELDENGNEL